MVFTRLAAFVLAGALTLSGPGIAFAQYLDEDDDANPVARFFRAEPNIPNNVPDENGCVKMCFRDTSPCDPMSFKRADGRCAHLY